MDVRGDGMGWSRKWRSRKAIKGAVDKGSCTRLRSAKCASIELSPANGIPNMWI